MIAADACREGVNFQTYRADLFHFNISWNPRKMEQRNRHTDGKLQREKGVRCRYAAAGGWS